MSLILSQSHLARKMRRHSLAGTRPLCVTVCEMLLSVHRVWGLVCHLFNSEMPLSRGLQQGGKTGTGCLCLPGDCIESLSFFCLPESLFSCKLWTVPPLLVALCLLFLPWLAGTATFFVGGWGASDRRWDSASVFPVTKFMQWYNSS